jgi:hypothetical protein
MRFRIPHREARRHALSPLDDLVEAPHSAEARDLVVDREAVAGDVLGRRLGPVDRHAPVLLRRQLERETLAQGLLVDLADIDQQALQPHQGPVLAAPSLADLRLEIELLQGVRLVERGAVDGQGRLLAAPRGLDDHRLGDPEPGELADALVADDRALALAGLLALFVRAAVAAQAQVVPLDLLGGHAPPVVGDHDLVGSDRDLHLGGVGVVSVGRKLGDSLLERVVHRDPEVVQKARLDQESHRRRDAMRSPRRE